MNEANVIVALLAGRRKEHSLSDDAIDNIAWIAANVDVFLPFSEQWSDVILGPHVITMDVGSRPFARFQLFSVPMHASGARTFGDFDEKASAAARIDTVAGAMATRFSPKRRFGLWRDIVQCALPDLGEADATMITVRLRLAHIGESYRALMPWQRYALVARFEDGVTRLNGFAYDAQGGYRPATPTGFEVNDRLDALRETTRVAGGAPWGACVVRIDRATQEISVEFEYDHPERWNVTPQNYAGIAARTRVG